MMSNNSSGLVCLLRGVSPIHVNYNYFVCLTPPLFGTTTFVIAAIYCINSAQDVILKGPVKYFFFIVYNKVCLLEHIFVICNFPFTFIP